MLDALKRWMGGKSSGPQWPAVEDWAERTRLRFKRIREGEGFVIDGGSESRSWRLEWGPPQRAYIQGHELRLRVELGLSSDWHMMVISQPLLEMLEKQAFERFTEGNQTIIDVNTPEEMRWLAMYPKVVYQAPKPLRSRFALISNVEALAQAWVDGPLLEKVGQAAERALEHQPPFVLMMLRGRLYLRTQMNEPNVTAIAQLIGLFETAAQQAVRAASTIESGDKSSGWGSSSGATAWQTQLGPEDPKDFGRH